MSVRWVSVEDIAEHLGVSKDTVYGWIAKKDMPAHKVGRLWKFKTDEVDGWVRNGQAADEQKEIETKVPDSETDEHSGGERSDG
jgi:excisionase family DNA binding protein